MKAAVAWCATCRKELARMDRVPSAFNHDDDMLMTAMRKHIADNPSHLCAWTREDLAELLVVKKRINRQGKEEEYIGVKK